MSNTLYTFGSAIKVSATDAKPQLQKKARNIEDVEDTTGVDGTLEIEITNGLQKSVLVADWTDDQTTKPQSKCIAEIVDNTTLLVKSSLLDQDPERDFKVWLITKVS